MTTPIGPYMNEDGDWWVPVDAASFREARGVVLGHLGYEVPEDGTLRYRGKSKTLLCNAHPAHEVGPECDDDCGLYVIAYHFEENRRW